MKKHFEGYICCVSSHQNKLNMDRNECGHNLRSGEVWKIRSHNETHLQGGDGLE
jgi:hypothetical protein